MPGVLTPNVSLIVIDPVRDQKLQIFLLESPYSMVFALILDISNNIGHPCLANCEGSISYLQLNFFNHGNSLLIHNDDSPFRNLAISHGAIVGGAITNAWM